MATTALSRGLSRVVSRSLRSEETDSTAERTGTGQEPPTLFFTLFHTGAWRILPYLLVSVLGVAVVIPALPVILTDYFAQRRQGGDTPVSCSSYPPAAQPSYCQDAHSDSVTWSSGASFVSNTIVAFFLTPFVGRLSDQLGRKPFMLASSVLSVLPLAVFFLSANNVISILWWFPAQVATAAVDKVSLAVAFTADLMPPSLRASTIGLVTASFACGIFVGPLISSRLTIQQITWTLPVFAAASLLWVVFAIPETTTAASRAEARASAAAAAAADTGALSGLASTWRIVMRSRLFLTLTAVMMVVGVVQEGLMDLLMQYLQIKVSFGVADNSAVLMVVGVGGARVAGPPAAAPPPPPRREAMLAQGARDVMLAFAESKTAVWIALNVGILGLMSLPTLSAIKSNNSAEHEQGAVQGALFGAKSLAQGTGPLIFAPMFAAFTRSDSPLPYMPGAPLLVGAALLLAASLLACSLPVEATERSAAAAAKGPSSPRSEDLETRLLGGDDGRSPPSGSPGKTPRLGAYYGPKGDRAEAASSGGAALPVEGAPGGPGPRWAGGSPSQLLPAIAEGERDRGEALA
eukprot:CAMPEP_0177591420 /NCGR_PEP_ID=MMETSP0419_2-20121207/7988_1 /TAXON_ID=582737 /ORGANISM="Tetraselmis sp., Strain GSL018" /LENGTH=576 /DNA_ID=CAMNT_0019082161 /DNA_START=84 /DNA_END=1813 /DNA_ORIENTATION=+